MSAAKIRRWVEAHAHALFIGMIVLVTCELMILSVVAK